jgi:WD40 repeat protein
MNKNSNINFQLSHYLAKNSYSIYVFDNVMEIFNSINDIFYLIYAKDTKSIISVDLINNKKIIEIKHAHNEYITNFRHYKDIINKRDLLLSISANDNNIKIWNVNVWENILNIIVNEKGDLDSSCFLNYNNQIYIITSNDHYLDIIEPIKVFDLEGNKIKELNDSSYKTYIIDSYYDNDMSKYFIITGNEGNCKSYDYENNKIYKLYCDDDVLNAHFSLIIYSKEKIVKLIESSEDGHIRIWDFHCGKLLKKIKVSNTKLYGICLWNNNCLFVGCLDKAIKLLDLNNGEIIKNYYGHTQEVITIKLIFHPIYGECLVSHGAGYDRIILWINEKK